mgnify:CR=1 FL=1
MRLSYLDILEQCFHDKFRGYNKQEVDTFLRLIADDFKSMAEEIKDKDSEIKNLLSALKSQPAEKDTSIALEKAKKIVNAAKNQAEQHRKESMKELEQLIQDIEELKKQKSTESANKSSITQNKHKTNFKSLKKKVGKDKAYAFAWAQHNKHGKPKSESAQRYNCLLYTSPSPRDS